MDRAAEIVASYSQNHEFSRPLSAMEILALAYDDMLAQALDARKEAREAKRQLESTIERRALEIVQGYESELLPPDSRDPTVWRLRLVPLMYETRHLSADPNKWDKYVVEQTCKTAGDVFARMIWQRCTEAMKTL
jgi:hypothetical protein